METFKMRMHIRSSALRLWKQLTGWARAKEKWKVTDFSFKQWQWIMLTSWNDTKSQTLWRKQVNTVNKIKQINLNKQPRLLPWRRNTHPIKTSCGGLGGDMRPVCAEKQHLIRAVAHHIPHHDTHRNSAWGLTPPEPGSVSQQHNHTGMRTNNSLVLISLQHTRTHRKYALHQHKWKRTMKSPDMKISRGSDSKFKCKMLPVQDVCACVCVCARPSEDIWEKTMP